MKREDFGAERWFSQWCAAEWLGFSARLCFCRLFFYLFFKTLSLCDLFLNPLLFIGVIFPFILAPVFFFVCERRRCRGSGFVHGHQISFTQF